jgi:hypothetical protein
MEDTGSGPGVVSNIDHIREILTGLLIKGRYKVAVSRDIKE